jgi:hypothetical protein
MPHVPIAAATLISDETKELIRAHDDSLRANQILFVSVLKAVRDANLPFKEQQKLFTALNGTANKMLDTRWAVGDTLKLLRGLAAPCGAETVLEGCTSTCPISADVQPIQASAPATNAVVNERLAA